MCLVCICLKIEENLLQLGFFLFPPFFISFLVLQKHLTNHTADAVACEEGWSNLWEASHKNVLNLLKVNFRYVSGFFASFAASVCGKRCLSWCQMGSIPYFSDSIYKTVCLFCAGWQISVIPFRVHESKQDKLLREKFFPSFNLMINYINYVITY